MERREKFPGNPLRLKAQTFAQCLRESIVNIEGNIIGGVRGITEVSWEERLTLIALGLSTIALLVSIGNVARINHVSAEVASTMAKIESRMGRVEIQLDKIMNASPSIKDFE